MTYTLLKRNPFARYNFIRELIPKDERGFCTWCGQPAKYRYGFDNDRIDEQLDIHTEQFCSVSCYRAYFGE